jgi:hypothetical protein
MTSLPLKFRVNLEDVIQNSPLVREIWIGAVRKTRVVLAVENSLGTAQSVFGALDDACIDVWELMCR